MRRDAGADVELIHHSDAGSQYTSYAFTQVLDDQAMLASIGSVGDAYDNALAESFVDSFKTELIRDRVGAPAASSIWRSSSTSAGSTPPACTKRLATVRRRRWRPSTLPGPF